MLVTSSQIKIYFVSLVTIINYESFQKKNDRVYFTKK
jgi:hypothetical protein